LSSKSIPSFSFTNTHFRFVLAHLTAGSGVEDSDKYLCAQVKIKNEGKTQFFIGVSQRKTLVDGSLVQGSVDFQVFADRGVVKRGESCTIHLSMIAKPTAVFSAIQEFLTVSIDEGIKIMITFVVINPFVPFFGTGFPCCIVQQVIESPVGLYEAPLILQMLKHQFIRQEGYSSPEVVRLISAQSHLHALSNRDVLENALCIRNDLEEETNAAELLRDFWSGVDAQKGKANAPLSPKEALGGYSVSGSSGSFRGVPPSCAQPAGYLPGAVVPTAPTSTSVTTFPNVHSAAPNALLKASPATLFALVTLFFAELPFSVVDLSLIGCEPIKYLETLQPCVQGLIMWVVDLCCGFLKHADETEITVRELALSWAAIFLSNGGERLFTAEEQPAEPINLSASAVGLSRSGRMTRVSAQQTPQSVTLYLHTVTSIVHWIALYEGQYPRPVGKK
jgi:hypothetical protein